MATGNKKGGGGMVLAGRQLVGIFALLVVMLGVVFTMGYVLGRSQYDTQIRAAASSVSPKAAGTPVKENSGSGTAKTSAAGKTPRATAPDWDFYHAGEPAKPVERLGGASDPVDAPPAPPEAVARAQPAARQPSEKQPTIIASLEGQRRQGGQPRRRAERPRLVATSRTTEAAAGAGPGEVPPKRILQQVQVR